MKRKWYAGALAWMLALSVTACSSGGSTPPPSTEAPTTNAPAVEEAKGEEEKNQGPAQENGALDLEGWGNQVKSQLDGTKIVVSMASHPSTEAFQAMAADFTDLTGIQVEWDVVEQTYLKNKQLLDFQGAHSYDVFMVDSFWNAEYGAKGVVAPLDSYLEDPQKTPDWYDKEDLIPAYCDLDRKSVV